MFDKLGVYRTNWENEILNETSLINENLKEINFSIIEMGNRLQKSLNDLNYTIEYKIDNLNKDLSHQLSKIDSSIRFNNFLTGIQTYQTYNLRKGK